MLGTFIITWRESIEAALIVGILLSYLSKTGGRAQFRYIYWGTFWAVLASLAFGGFSNLIAALLQDYGQDLFEIGILVIAVVVLTHMVIWMHHNARELRGELQHKAGQALAKHQLWALATVAFVGVFREGVETVLFLWGLFLQGPQAAGGWSPLTGGILGIALGVCMAYLFFRGFGHLDLRRFFRVTGVLLILMAAGMLATAIGKLVAAGFVPGLIEPVWNTSWLLDEGRMVGSLVKGLFGYRSSPSLIQLLVYLAYFPLVYLILRRQKHDLAQ